MPPGNDPTSRYKINVKNEASPKLMPTVIKVGAIIGGVLLIVKYLYLPLKQELEHRRYEIQTKSFMEGPANKEDIIL